MKLKKMVNLGNGEWIISNPSGSLKKGKFAIGRVKGFKLILEDTTWVDLDKSEVKETKKGEEASI